MTEDIYEIVKRRFPLTKHMRVDFDNAINIIVTPATLHNIALDWADPMPQDDHPNLDKVPEAAHPPQQDYADVVLLNGLNPFHRRNIAAVARNHYRAMMDPVPTEREMRKMAVHRAEAEVRR